MATNPYYITFNFPEEHIPAGKHRVIIKFTVENLGTHLDVEARESGVEIVSLGTVDTDVDRDNLLMNPSTMDLDIYDSLGALKTYLFSDTWSKLKKDGLVIFEVDRGKGYAEEFVGNISFAETEYKEEQKLFLFRCRTYSAQLYDKLLWSQDDPPVALNPLGYSEGEAVSVKDLITDIYHSLDSSISIEWKQDWIFYGRLS